MENLGDQVVTLLRVWGLKVLAAIAVFIIGRIVAGLVRGGVRNVMTRAASDPAIVNFVASLAYYVVIIFTILAVLGKFGFETASLVAILGAAAFAIGFALQGSLANFAAGVMLLVFRPYKLGQYVEVAGVAGTVKDMGLFTTTMNTPDNVRIIVPNGKVFGDTIKNYSAEETRRIDLVIGIGYGSPIGKAIEIIEQILAAEERVLKDPAPTIAVSELADSSVNLVVRPWSKGADYWNTRFDLMRRIKEQFDANDIEIPFPQMTVHKGDLTA